MQDMDDRALLARNAHEALRALQRRRHVAPDVMRIRVARHAQRLAFVEAIFVLGRKGRAAARGAENARNARIVLHQQRASRRTHEHLDACRARQALEVRNVGNVFVCAADPECEVAMHPVVRARNLVGEFGFARRQRIGVGHFEHGRHAAEHGAARAGFEVFLVGRAGFAEMHLRVDHARQDGQAAAVDPFTRRRLRKIADGGDRAAFHADVALSAPVLVDELAAGKNEVEGLGHRGSFGSIRV